MKWRILYLFIIFSIIPIVGWNWKKDSSTNGGNSTQGNLVPVAGGTFTAKSTPISSRSTLATISSFKIDKYEVTYELWTEVRDWSLAHGYTDLPAGQNGCSPAKRFKILMDGFGPPAGQNGGSPALLDNVGSNNPVTMVNWYDVVKWCNARSEKDGLTPVYYTDSTQSSIYRTGQIDINIDAVKWPANGYRLPTECEWEYAARGGNQTHDYMYSGSNNDLDEVAWYKNNSGDCTHPVGQKKANELGIYDMSGNVVEWCWDWYGYAYPSGVPTDLKGPTTTKSMRMARGGSMGDDGPCQVDCRNCLPIDRYDYVGFRCVKN